MKTIIASVLCAALMYLPAQSDELKDSGPSAIDILALLETSWMKVKITGKPLTMFDLEFRAPNGGKSLKLAHMGLFPTGTGELCLMSKNSESVSSRGQNLGIVFSWTNGTANFRGVLKFAKPWDWKHGFTFSDRFLPGTFHGERHEWNVDVDSIEIVQQIFWSKKAPGMENRDNTHVGDLILRRLDKQE